MRIKIERITNTYNYGSLMMAINMIVMINNNIKDVKFYCDVRTEEDLNRLRYETKMDNIYRYSPKVYAAGRICNYIAKFKDKYKEFDAVIILGGDDISEYYNIDALPNRLRSFVKKRIMGMKVILIGQTIGPFTGRRIKMARNALNKVRIYTRDDNCLEYIKSIGITTGIRGRDLAFINLPRDGKEILYKYNLNDKEYITLVLSGLYKLYTKNYEAYIGEHIKIIRNLLNNPKVKGKNIVILPHVTRPNDTTDLSVVRDVENKMKEDEKERIIFINDEMMASEARCILANGLFTITGRMHAAVSTFFKLKPAIALSYSVKYDGVIGNGLKRRDLLIEAANDEFWIEGKISDLVSSKVNYVIDNYNILNEEIKKEIHNTENILLDELNDIIQYINA
ncbi:polysaccharide pyruvyl transferase family protein [Clostridium bornimense]|uniref:polysaccharide pyruvyl transferase family protein n=1 Tax=Clostridium bornimense TaxID=1216932 RepID=UPI001C122825|nr:polysaccharide pyruvyl transferase family protein [Clostridium bornimense]MBU5315063.1 polysaccharide pyruvyl transferase family protein [Clostridium bornimense]